MPPGLRVAHRVIRTSIFRRPGSRSCRLPELVVCGSRHDHRYYHIRTPEPLNLAPSVQQSLPSRCIPKFSFKRAQGTVETGSRLYSTKQREGSDNTHELPSSASQRRSDASKRLSKLMDRIESSVFIAGQRLNDLTGYTGIDALRREIDNQGQWSFSLCQLGY